MHGVENWHFPRLPNPDAGDRETERERVGTILPFDIVVACPAQDDRRGNVPYSTVPLRAPLAAGHTVLHVPSTEFASATVLIPLAPALRTPAVISDEDLINDGRHEYAQVASHDPGP